MDRNLATVEGALFDVDYPQREFVDPAPLPGNENLLIWRVGPRRVRAIEIDGVEFEPRKDTREPEALRRFSELERFIVK